MQNFIGLRKPPTTQVITPVKTGSSQVSVLTNEKGGFCRFDRIPTGDQILIGLHNISA